VNLVQIWLRGACLKKLTGAASELYFSIYLHHSNVLDASVVERIVLWVSSVID